MSYSMRRSQKEVTDKAIMYDIIERCDVVRVGFSVNDVPYIVPMNFGFKDDVFYFHGAQEGRKIDMMKTNPKVCFELDTDHQLVGKSDRACDWTMTFASIIGNGTISIVTDTQAKIQALNVIMQQYGGKDAYQYSQKMLERINILRLDIEDMTCKKTG